MMSANMAHAYVTGRGTDGLVKYYNSKHRDYMGEKSNATDWRSATKTAKIRTDLISSGTPQITVDTKVQLCAYTKCNT
jgi:hypothetical protein